MLGGHEVMPLGRIPGEEMKKDDHVGEKTDASEGSLRVEGV